MTIEKAVAIINTSMWLGSSIAISVGLYITHDIRCLFFFLIPALSMCSTKTTLVEGDE